MQTEGRIALQQNSVSIFDMRQWIGFVNHGYRVILNGGIPKIPKKMNGVLRLRQQDQLQPLNVHTCRVRSHTFRDKVLCTARTMGHPQNDGHKSGFEIRFGACSKADVANERGASIEFCHVHLQSCHGWPTAYSWRVYRPSTCSGKKNSAACSSTTKRTRSPIAKKMTSTRSMSPREYLC